jgi:hypothetical protein
MISLIEIYYLWQIFLIGYYSNIDTFLLIINAFIIYTSSKIQNNPILNFFENNINEFTVFPLINLSYMMCFIDQLKQYHLCFIINFIMAIYINIIYNMYWWQDNMKQIIYLTLCLMILL